MEAAVDEAKKLGMDVWFYDENGWPSGFAGGELLKEGNYVAYLELKEESAYSADAFASYVLVGQEYRRVTGEQGKTVYYNIYVCYTHSYVDLLDPEVTRKFISSTHENNYERFKKEFGKHHSKDNPSDNGQTPHQHILHKHQSIYLLLGCTYNGD